MNMNTAMYAPFFMMGAVVLIAIIVAIATSSMRRKRREALASFAQREGGQFYPDVSALFAAQLRPLYPFREMQPYIGGIFTLGSQEYSTREAIQNMVIASKGGVDWYAFDYRYTVNSGKSQATFTRGVVMARVPISFPGLEVSQENLLTRIESAVGFHDIQFESEEFNKRYRISCQDKKAAFDLFCPQMIEYFLGLVPRHWQIWSYYVVIVSPYLLAPGDIYAIVGEMAGMLEHIPDYVRHDWGFQPPWQTPYDGQPAFGGV